MQKYETSDLKLFIAAKITSNCFCSWNVHVLAYEIALQEAQCANLGDCQARRHRHAHPLKGVPELPRRSRESELAEPTSGGPGNPLFHPTTNTCQLLAALLHLTRIRSATF